MKLLDLLLKIMKSSNVKTTNGWTMTGICSQWAKRNKSLTNNEFVIYTDILDKTFSQVRRWCFMSYNEMSLTNKNTISNTIRTLEDKGIIRIDKTNNPENGHRSKNQYFILEPKEYIVNFVFKDINKNSNKIDDDTELEKHPWD